MEVWGRFDIQHIEKYVLKDNFGTAEFDEIFKDNYTATGRGGSIFLFIQPERLGYSNTQELIFGHGLFRVVVREGGRFTRERRLFA
jgi:phage terminase large subunit-like protein